jgi:outer membrane protein insertion porin family
MTSSLLPGRGQPLITAAIAIVIVFGTAEISVADEPKPPTVAGIDWEGVSALDESDLRQAIVTTAPTWRFWRKRPEFDDATLTADIARIETFYRDRGYYNVKVEYELDWNDTRSKVRILFRIDEGEPVELAAWHLETSGFSEEEAATLRAVIPEELGTPFGVVVYRGVREQLLRQAANLGRPAARLHGGAEVDVEARSAVVRWRISPGPLVRFGSIRVEGLSRVDEGLVRGELDVHEGDTFSLDTLKETEEFVYDLGLFRSVAVEAQAPAAEDVEPEADAQAEEPSPAAEATWPVVVRVRERPPRSIRLSVGYGTEDEFRAQGAWEYRNFLGGARKLEVRGKYSSLVAGFDVQFTQPYLRARPLYLALGAALFQETVPGYDANRLRVTSLVGRRLRDRWKLRGGYRIEWGNVTDFKADDPLGSGPKEARLASLVVGLNRTTVDDPAAPRQGTWFDLAAEPYIGGLGSEVGYVQLLGEARGFVPLWSTVLALRAKLGTIQPYNGGIGEIPVYKRFYSGGGNSVRGFAFQELGPLDQNNNPLGGLTLAEASVELRFPIWKVLGGVVFVDAGQVRRRPFSLRVDDFRYSTGPGLRLNTPVGSVGADFGIIINPPANLDRFRVNLSVIQTF